MPRVMPRVASLGLSCGFHKAVGDSSVHAISDPPPGHLCLPPPAPTCLHQDSRLGQVQTRGMEELMPRSGGGQQLQLLRLENERVMPEPSVSTGGRRDNTEARSTQLAHSGTPSVTHALLTLSPPRTASPCFLTAAF